MMRHIEQMSTTKITKMLTSTMNANNKMLENKRSKICFVRKSGTSYVENFDVDIPVTHEVVHGSQLRMLEAKAEKYDKIVNTLQCGRYKG
eukprot:8665208-Ditylum_brightwellii.AAC.1